MEELQEALVKRKEYQKKEESTGLSSQEKNRQLSF